MDDCRNCQTSTATPAEPGDLSWRLVDEFRASLRALVAEFGQPAIDAALNELRLDA
jgi:hypothetical protein